MKRMLILIVMVLAASHTMPAQDSGAMMVKKPTSPMQQAILKLEQEWVAALLKADTPALERIYDDTLVYTHSSGSVDDKAKYIAGLKSGATKYLAIDRDEIKATVYGDSAVATCRAALKLNSGGQERAFTVRMIHVYAKQKGQWRMIAHQTTCIG